MLCSLCSRGTLETNIINQKEYLHCLNCKAIFLASKHFLSPAEEKARYEKHNNDIHDPGYQEFVRPIVENVIANHSPGSHGLDYGCGTGPVITAELSKKGYNTKLYDPYFNPSISVLKRQYDYIVCCEVMEHFQHPIEEFRQLKSLLNPGGSLYCKTSLYDDKIDFDNWYYKDDPTHVTFYTAKALHYIKDRLGYLTLEIKPGVLILGN
ncbi:class I SAM-dependent methyltransferase [Gramella sp. GC03-9]|uniref:Class I SAM-dependent methyltransferase n=1 Tax=Christiangramia oceanisediminis TaxID=2920386 RepID=A0A9X2KZ80_9FLAO|nr:class I SAM-dependent methyltransferase [Gramella oceanisediminis]MCP9200939.1 class I SAM-dependent methyltransferase [Gramella oceanisediminis]